MKDAQSQLLQQILGEVTALRLALLLIVPAAIMLAVFGFISVRNRPKPVPRDIKTILSLGEKIKTPRRRLPT